MNPLRTLSTAASLSILCMAAISPLTAAESKVDTALQSAHRDALGTAEAGLNSSAEKFVTGQDLESAKAAKELLAILKLPRQEITAPSSLLGKWRVRSIQTSDLGVYAYPFFDSRFYKGTDGEIVFHKNTGSQRSKGIVGKSSDGDLLFLGATYYDNEKPTTYSTLLEDKSQGTPERDRAGKVYQLKKNHLLMIFGAGEIYELKR